MKAITVTQGSPEWSTLRAQHNTASEAPVMMGASKYQSRDELLRQKATGIVPEVSSHQQAIFDRGHAAEAAARAILEELTGEDFYPITAVSDDGKLLASVDGITMDDGTLFEHKLWSEKLAGDVRGGGLQPHYFWQLEQQLLVTGAQKAIFVCSDGTKENWVQMDYYPVLGRAEQLAAGWAQFDADKAAYVPSAIVEMPKAEVKQALPALFIHAKGEITADNLPAYGSALAAELKSIRSIVLVTDQDFSNAKSSAQFLRDQIEKIKLEKETMLAQTVSIGQAVRMIDVWCEDMRLTALQLEKDVVREDLAKKSAMIAATKAAYADHVSALEIEIAPHRVIAVAPVFAEAIKNKRSFASMQDGLNTMLANAKIAADGSAMLVRHNLAYFAEHAKDHAALFADKADLVQKPLDYVTLVIASRIAEHVKAEAQKEEATRQRIRAEEVAKAEREARQKLMDEQAAELAESNRMSAIQAQGEKVAAELAAQQNAPQIIQAAPAVAFIAVPAIQTVAPAASTVRQFMPAKQSISQGPPSMKLGDINAMLSPITLTADGLETLGFPVAATLKGAKLYYASDLVNICATLRRLLDNALGQQAA